MRTWPDKVTRMPEMDNDPSASTARFRAFAERVDSEASSPRRGGTPAGRVLILAVVVVCAAIVIGFIAASL